MATRKKWTVYWGQADLPWFDRKEEALAYASQYIKDHGVTTVTVMKAVAEVKSVIETVEIEIE